MIREAGLRRSPTDTEQARRDLKNLLEMMDVVGNKVAQAEIAMIKVVAPKMVLNVIDRAIQAHGGGGVSADFGLAYAWARSRVMRESSTARTRCTSARLLGWKLRK